MLYKLMKKSLLISRNPTYNTFNDIAFAFSVIDSLKVDYRKWLISNFINIYYKKNWDTICFRMPYCYRWKCFRSNLIVFNSYKYTSFVKSIEKQIDKNRYVYICVNEKFIPQRAAYNTYNFVHNLYIYGYDDEKREFLTAAYNTTRHFTTQEISYKNVFDAQKNKNVKNLCISFSLNKNFKFDKLNKFKIKVDLFKYFFPISKYSGINVFKYIIKHYQQREIKMGYAKLLCEHINILSQLSLSELKFNCDELIKLSEQLFYISLKYTLTFNDTLLSDAQDLIKKIKSLEINMFYDCYFKTLPKPIPQLFARKYKKYY